MNETISILKVLEHVNPAELNYQEWVNVGMALKEEGFTASHWDEWSRQDSNRYRPGECFKKWTTFRGTGIPVTGGTIMEYAKRQGWKPQIEGHELDWNDEIEEDFVIVDKNWIEGKEIEEPSTWHPVKDLITYLETLFDSTENVGYVTQTWQKEDKYLPTKGAWDRSAGQLIEELNKCNGDICSVIGDYSEQAGAWIRFNPLDGQGVKNENVTDFRYALVESDSMEIDKQNAILRELELPIACLVHSGNKSIHAIVRVDAGDYTEYRKRVDYLYNVCEKNGLQIDTQNRNPSRLSRMPGVIRNGHKQFLIDTNIGKQNWAEWYEWIEGINDDLPDPESLDDFWDNLPELAPPLINGILRQGHKLLLAGPSKAGKSYALIEMCIAIAEGAKWFNWPCAQGKVLYVNLELDRASCLHRFKDVYQSLGYQPLGMKNIDIWNLRGKAVPMDKLAPKLIRRAQKKGYIAVIIDPIYKVITGDENSADQMANFCNQFDKIASDLGCAVIYCHHHSKGSQGSKRAMDRASGSGVFARDPDALLDLIELEIDVNLRKQQKNRAIAGVIAEHIKKNNYSYYIENVGQDDILSKAQMTMHAENALNGSQIVEMQFSIGAAERRVENMSAWRIEGTLREFASFKPVNLFFDYPIHRPDESGVLKDLEPEGDKAPWQKAIDRRKSPEQKSEDRKKSLEIAYEACNIEGKGVTINELAEYMGVTKRTVWNRLGEYKEYKKLSEEGKDTLIVLNTNL